MDKTLKVFTVADDLKAALSGCRLGKKLEDFLKCIFNFLISLSCSPGGLHLSPIPSLVPVFLPAPHCCSCLVYLAFSPYSILAIVRSGSGTKSTDLLNAPHWCFGSWLRLMEKSVSVVMSFFLWFFHQLLFLLSPCHSSSQNFTATVVITFPSSLAVSMFWGGCVDSEAKTLLYLPGLVCVRNFCTRVLCGHQQMLAILQVKNPTFHFSSA